MIFRIMSSGKEKLPGILLVFLSVLIFTACGTGRDSNTEASAENFREVRELVNSRNFEIQNEWAMPASGIRVSLIGNPNYIRFKGDSVDIVLPYFGVRHMGGGYGGSNGGIRYEGTVENLDIEENTEPQNLELSFEGEQGSEHLEFSIRIFANGRTRTRVNSSQRQLISYDGTIKPMQETTR